MRTITASNRASETDHGRRVYDWWSAHRRAYELFVRLALLGREHAARERALSVLDLRAGEAVLDVGCGAGVNFEALAARVGSRGTLVGLDYSRGMVRKARARGSVTPNASSIAVVRGDAARPPCFDRSFDAAYATLSVSAMPNADTAIEAVHAVLRPGGRFVVLDARPFQEGPWRALNPIVNPISAYATNWQPERSVVGILDRTFAESETWTTNGGTLYVAVGRKRPET